MKQIRGGSCNLPQVDGDKYLIVWINNFSKYSEVEAV